MKLKKSQKKWLIRTLEEIQEKAAYNCVLLSKIPTEARSDFVKKELRYYSNMFDEINDYLDMVSDW